MQVGDLSPAVVAIERHVLGLRHKRAPQRLVLPISAVGSCTPGQKILAALGRRAVIGVVVSDLVVIPSHDPRRSGMGSLQIRIRFIQRIPITVILQAVARAAVVLPRTPRRIAVFINIVAHKQHHIQRFTRHVLVGAKIAVLVILTRSQGQSQGLAAGWGGQRTGFTHGAKRLAG